LKNGIGFNHEAVRFTRCLSMRLPFAARRPENIARAAECLTPVKTNMRAHRKAEQLERWRGHLIKYSP